MKTTKMIMAKFGLKFTDANKIVTLARSNLGLSTSVAWTEELEAEAFRLCSGESDSNNNNNQTNSDPSASASNNKTAASISSSVSTLTASTTSASTSTSPSRATTKKKTIVKQPQQVSEESSLGRSPTKVRGGCKMVTDMQHDTLLEGVSPKRMDPPKLPVRRDSNGDLDDSSGGPLNCNNDKDDGDSSSDSSDSDGDRRMPQIRPLRRTDSRSRHG
jgi:hypothetical protein